MPDGNDHIGEWRVLDGIDPSVAEFPFETRLVGEDILVLKTADGFRGVQTLCPHQGVSLLKAVLMSNDSMIRCPRHNFIFRLNNGDGVNCRGLTMKVYAIRENGGQLEGLIPG
jgi:nitrite reductase/ring-hydroxylating ferredoxin subunit